MKKHLILLLMLIFSTCLYACNSSTKHDWGKWKDNYDGLTHTRICKENYNHSETAHHAFNSGEIVKQVSDLQNGLIKYTCIDCGFQKESLIAPTGNHDFSLEIADEEHLKKNVSSATKVYYKSCSNCGAYGNENYVFEATNLPSEYLEVEYLKSTGTQYIDTGFKANSDTHIIVKASFTGPYSLYGGSPGYMNFTSTSSSAIGYFYYDGYETGRSDIGDFSNKIHVFEQNKNVCYIDGEEFYRFDYSKWQDKNNLYLFGRNNNGSLHDAGGIVKIYSCQIFDNGTLILDYVPVYKIDKKEFGLYDIITNKFYNDTHNFSVGDNKDTITLPEGYNQVEYIESSNMQYINTGIYYDNKPLSVDITFSYNQLKDNSTIIGSNNSVAHFMLREVGKELIYYYGNKQVSLGEIEARQKYNIKIDYNDSSWSYSGSLGANSGSFDSPLYNKLPLYIFDSCYESTVNRGSNQSANISANAKLYDCKIWKDGLLVRDYIPCIRSLDGKSGLYDLVSNTFFTYSKTFNFGNTVDNSQLPSKYVQVEYIEGNNSNYIDTEIIPNQDSKIEITFEANTYEEYGIFVYGSAISYNKSAFELYSWFWTLQFNYGTGSDHTYPVPDVNTKITAIQDKNNYSLIYNNDTYSGSYNYNNFTCPDTLTLFASNRHDKLISKGNLKIYSCKIYNKETLLRDFVPCINIETKEVGLYDLVSKKFFTHETNNMFEGGEIAGHDFDDGIIIQETTYYNDGDTVYTCNVCGKQIHKFEEKYAYKISIEIDEGIENIKIFRDHDPNLYENTLTTYSRNKNTFNYSKVDAIIICEIIFKDNYILDQSIFSDANIVITQIDNRYILSNIKSDLDIKLTSKIKL